MRLRLGFVAVFAAAALAAIPVQARFTQQGNKLVATDAAGTAQQGYSVALSADGATAIVGGYRDNGDVGAVWIFTRSSGVWAQQSSRLRGSGAVGGALQGTSVALAADGNTAMEKHATVTSISSSVNPSNVGEAVTFTATVTTDGGAPAAGDVTFIAGTQTLGAVALNGGVAMLSTDALPAGRHRIKARFNRNGRFYRSADRLQQRVRN